MHKGLVAAVIVLLLALVAETAYLIKTTLDLKRQQAQLAAHTERSAYSGPLPASAPLAQRAVSSPVRWRSVHLDPDPLGPSRADWDPFAEMEEIRGLMNRMFRDSFSRGLSERGPGAFVQSYDPDADVKDTGKEYVYRFDLPGLDKDKISVSTQHGMLTVSGERRTEKEEDGSEDGYYRMERSFGAFSRSFPLPEDADAERMSAEQKDGVLTVRVPKSPSGETSAPKRVTVT
ncbi:MAG: hypothetical protein MOGMAGMI_02222 [Candidatus Omnitrophica bacterium]|nr:hypothetical protein [Candidatus Omnitrophota bacterium]